jgi:hypothetical protein
VAALLEQGHKEATVNRAVFDDEYRGHRGSLA